MQKVIIHTATRVIRRLTLDEAPKIQPDESIVEIETPLDLAGGFWKLDAKNEKVMASTLEVDQAGVDDTVEAQKKTVKIQNYHAAVDDIIDSMDASTLATLKPKLKVFFQALRNIR